MLTPPKFTAAYRRVSSASLVYTHAPSSYVKSSMWEHPRTRQPSTSTNSGTFRAVLPAASSLQRSAFFLLLGHGLTFRIPMTKPVLSPIPLFSVFILFLGGGSDSVAFFI